MQQLFVLKAWTLRSQSTIYSLIIKTGLIKWSLTIQVGKEYGTMGFPCKSQQITEKYHNNYSHMECRRRFYFNFWIAEQSNLLWVVLGDYLSTYLFILPCTPKHQCCCFVFGKQYLIHIICSIYYISVTPILLQQLLITGIHMG